MRSRSAIPVPAHVAALARIVAGTSALCVGATCSGGAHSDPTSNIAPIADAGIGTDVLLGDRVELDGSGSWDPDGSELAFAWTLTNHPTDSAATLEGRNGATPSFIADQPGDYEVSLVVTDKAGATDESVVAFHAAPPTPAADAGADIVTDVGSLVVLDGVASVTDGSNDYTVTWGLTGRPPGSTAALSDIDTLSPSLVPDLSGLFTAELRVTTPELVATDTVDIFAVAPSQMLFDFPVVDAEYSDSLDRVIAVSDGPPMLYVIDPVSGSVDPVGLPYAPTCVSIDPTGRRAAVGHDGEISTVDLDALVVDATWPVPIAVWDIVYAGNAYVYSMEDVSSWSNVVATLVSTGETTNGAFVYGRTKMKLQPGSPAIYGATNGLSPADIEKYDISLGNSSNLGDSPYHGDYKICGDLWLLDSGLSIITRCGNVFYATAGPADMTYRGTLEDGFFAWADHDPTNGMIVTLRTAEPGGTTGIRYYDDETFELLSAETLPSVFRAGEFVVPEGHFAFYKSDGSEVYLLFSAGIYGLITLE